MTKDNITTNTSESEENDFSLVPDNFEGRAEQAYAEEAGTLLFQSALMRFLADITEEEAEEFESFVEKNIQTETFIEVLCDKYPSFKEILDEEMAALTKEMNSLK